VTPADWATVRKQFEALCDLSTAEQQQALAAADLSADLRTHLQALLDGDRADKLREDALAQAPKLTLELTQDELIGTTLGAYKIESLAGVGGMGRVYRARREDGRFQGEVAIKFVADSANTQSFLRERRVLARLQHPHIARLLDAGEDQAGRPYLVMEYVAGEQIDQHCKTARLSDLDRIKLVVAAARAIAHAHELLVLHRDLKPANLMVSPQGELKILDFGIAKLLDSDADDGTQTTARYFTLRYAPPEQIIGDTVSTATDIYALAVVLYELISKLHPFMPTDTAPAELTERILTNRPTPLRSALRVGARDCQLGADRLRDLETVLQHALTRDDQPGYGSAKAFADDLQRIIDDQPVSVTAVDPIAAVRRWVRRHRLAAAALMLAMLSISIGLGTALWQAGIARSERDAALHEAARAERIARFLTQMFEAPRPSENRGEALQASELLDRGRDRLATELVDQPLMRAQLQATIAETYRSMGVYDQSEALLLEALQLTSQSAAAAPLEARLNAQLGRLHNYQGRWEDADQRLLAATTLARQQAQPQNLALALRTRTVTLLNQARSDEAKASISEALTLYRQLPEPNQADIRVAESLLATIAMQQGDLELALAAYQRVVADERGANGADSARLSISLNNLAAVQMRLNRPALAASNYAEAARIARLHLGAEHRDEALPLLGLGMALRVQAQIEQSLAALAQSTQIYRRWDGDTHAATAYAQLLYAETLWLDQQLAAALAALGSADQVLLDQYGPEHVYSCRSALLRANLTPEPEPDSSSRPLHSLIECLDKEQSPPNVRLIAAWAKVRAAIDSDAAAVATLPQLSQRSTELEPVDLSLDRAIQAWVRRH